MLPVRCVQECDSKRVAQSKSLLTYLPPVPFLSAPNRTDLPTVSPELPDLIQDCDLRGFVWAKSCKSAQVAVRTRFTRRAILIWLYLFRLTGGRTSLSKKFTTIV